MKKLLFCTALILAAPAYALQDVTNDDGVLLNGSVNSGVINNNAYGPGSGSSTSNRNENKNTNSNVNVSNSKSNASSRSSASAKQGQFQSQNARSSVKDSGNSENSNTAVVNQNYKRNPVSTAYSAPLVAADDTCMGSTSAGAQGIGFGVSLGSTWQDEDCVRRKDARELRNMGHAGASIALMCQNKNVRKAMRAAGDACPVDVDDEVVSSGWHSAESGSIAPQEQKGPAKN